MTLSDLIPWVKGVPDSLPEPMRPMAVNIAESFLDTSVRLMDLGLGKCRMCVAAKNDYVEDPNLTLRVATKSTVGAGDAMLGGMLLGYEKEKDMGKAFRYGVAAGAASVMTEGTQLIVPEDFYNLLDQVRIQEV